MAFTKEYLNNSSPTGFLPSLSVFRNCFSQFSPTTILARWWALQLRMRFNTNNAKLYLFDYICTNTNYHNPTKNILKRYGNENRADVVCVYNININFVCIHSGDRGKRCTTIVREKVDKMLMRW